MVETLTRLKVRDAEREDARKGVSFLEHASALSHGGLFLTGENGERMTADMPASLLAPMQSILAALAESGEALILKSDAEISPEKAAEILGISRPLVYQRMDAGSFPSVRSARIGGFVPSMSRPSSCMRTGDVLSRRPCPPTRKISKRTMPGPIKAVLDANVLTSNHLRNLLLQMAQNDLFVAKWSEIIEQEWLRNMEPRTRARIEAHTLPLIRTWFVDALVTGFDLARPIGQTDAGEQQQPRLRPVSW